MTYAPMEPDPSPGMPATERGTPRRGLGCAFEILETLVLTIVIYLVIHNFVAQPFMVQQDSMIPTLLPEEYVLIDKLTPRFSDYRRGDIVVFAPPSGYEQNGVPFIKRVIGTPGDVVTLTNGRVFVAPAGGEPRQIVEEYIATLDGAFVPTQPQDAPGTSEWRVPDAMYFVMGDNRERSQDSRAFGPIARDLIVGRAWVRYFPINRIGFLERPAYAALGPDAWLPWAALLGVVWLSPIHRSRSRP